MSYWDLYVQESGGDWPVSATSVVPRPNEDLNLGVVSTQQSIQLIDGSFGYYTPETKSVKQELQFGWVMQDDDFRQEIEGYIANHDYIKIVTHLGDEFIGRFKTITSKWLVGEEPDEFEMLATFERME